ncbi:transporter substrate-binding domain-containing protein [Geminicoccaceae bacterium 1502E]|nr:transporter substrate-binding domain-containing protein [Geminicoccaceae bacterium 1502E]
MRLLPRLLGLLGLLVPLAAAEAQPASNLQRVLESGTLRVGTTGDFKPMSFKDPGSGDYVGYDIDVVKQLAEDMGVAIQFVPTDWKTLVNGIVADKYDITTSASLNVQRAKVAGFSEPYVDFGTVPMTLRGNLGQFQGWDSIDRPEVTVAVTLGTVFEQQARQFFPNAKIVAVESPARDFQEVLSGRALVAITSNVEAASLKEAYPELVTVPVDQARARRPGAFLLPQADQVWINFVNHWVRLNHANGVLGELQKKWRIAD